MVEETASTESPMTGIDHNHVLYHSRLKELWNKYDRIVPVPSCGCDESKDYVEHLKEQRLLQFLAVNQAYEMIIEVESNKFIGANSADQPDPLAMSFGSGRGHNIKELSIGDNPIKVLFGEDNLIMEKSLS
ncbi:hypothetical protein KY285_032818 [Solanum tuberosum]|nr:hypothetical protein KY285_032818 [Solanum tuberosum]